MASALRADRRSRPGEDPGLGRPRKSEGQEGEGNPRKRVLLLRCDEGAQWPVERFPEK